MSSTARWNDEVSSHVRLDLPSTARPPERLLHPVFEPHHGRASGADSGEKREPAGDIDTVVVASLEALDPGRPIREADNVAEAKEVRSGPERGVPTRFVDVVASTPSAPAQ